MSRNGKGPGFCGRCEPWVEAAEIAIEDTHMVDCRSVKIPCPRGYGFACGLYSQPLSEECKREHIDKSYISF